MIECVYFDVSQLFVFICVTYIFGLFLQSRMKQKLIQNAIVLISLGII